MIVRTILIAMLLLTVWLSGGVVTASPASILVTEADDEGTSVGVIALDARPEEVHAALTDFPNWPKLFSDVRWTKVKRRNAGHIQGEFQSLSLGHAHELEVFARPPSQVRFQVVPEHGVDLWGEFVLAPAGSGGTHVRYALHSDVAGILGWFASNSSLRDKRRAKVRRDLQDLLRRFPGTVGQSASGSLTPLRFRAQTNDRIREMVDHVYASVGSDRQAHQ